MSSSSTASAISAKLHSFNNPLTFLPDHVAELLLWTNPVHTGVLFGIGLFGFWLNMLCGYSITYLASLVLVLQIATCFMYINSASVLFSSPTANKSRGVPETAVLIPPEAIEAFLRQALHGFNSLSVFVYNIYHCKDNVRTLKVLLGCIFANLFSRLFSDTSIVFLAFLFIFLAPKIYVQNQSSIDQVVGRAHAAIDAQFARVSQWISTRIPAMAARAQKVQQQEKQEKQEQNTGKSHAQ